MTWFEYFMYGYDTLKKEEKNIEMEYLKGFPATSWVINFDWNRGEM